MCARSPRSAAAPATANRLRRPQSIREPRTSDEVMGGGEAASRSAKWRRRSLRTGSVPVQSAVMVAGSISAWASGRWQARAWTNHTQRYRDMLPPYEQAGFDTAAEFSLPRNKYAVQSNVGAAIASTDRDLAAARKAENDVFFWLGFDIASGIFGSPAAGAQGNTATGPGSMGIRSELNAAGQRGFDAATALHLGRRYK